jgi:hypothetical protein
MRTQLLNPPFLKIQYISSKHKGEGKKKSTTECMPSNNQITILPFGSEKVV